MRPRTNRPRGYERPGRFPSTFPVEVGPWQTRNIGPFQVRYRRKPRHEHERRRLARAWMVLGEHVLTELRIYHIAALIDRFSRWAAARKPE